MAIYRTISMSFWTDNKVVDDFTPEDRYFYLYLFTNPHTNLCGCYEVSLKQMAYEVGYSIDSINMLLKRFEEVHNVLRYSEKTKEILLLNWHKYNWTTSDKFRKPLLKEISEVKCEPFRHYLQDLADGKETGYRIDTNCINITVAVTDTDTVANTSKTINKNNNSKTNNTEDSIKEIIDYLNTKVGTNYRANTVESTRLINGRLQEGRTIDDFKYVIDVKAEEWMGTSQEQYLRPKTLFAQSNFENYLQQHRGAKKNKQPKESNKSIDWDELTEWAKQKDREPYEGEIVYDQ